MPVVSSQEAADYTLHGTPDEHCSICNHWFVGPTSTSDGTCRIVSGNISPDGWCRYFEHIDEAA